MENVKSFPEIKKENRIAKKSGTRKCLVIFSVFQMAIIMKNVIQLHFECKVQSIKCEVLLSVALRAMVNV